MKRSQMLTWFGVCFALVLTTPALQAADAKAPEAPVVEESPLFLPEVTEQAGCTKCLGAYNTGPGGGLPSHWGMGATCAAAQTDLVNQLWTAAEEGCSARFLGPACSVFTVVTTSCWWSSTYNKYVVDGYGVYKCETYIC